MKKILSIFLIGILLLGQVSFAATVAEADVSIDNDVVCITGKTPLGRGGIVTVTVVPFDNSTILYQNEMEAGEDGEFKFQFPMLTQDKHGLYFVNIGGAGLVQIKKSYAFLDKDVDVPHARAFNKKTEDAIVAVLSSDGMHCGIDVSGAYATLSDAGKLAVRTTLSNRTYTSTIAVYNAFQKALALALLNQASQAEMHTVLSAYEKELGIHLQGPFEKLADKTSVYTALFDKHFSVCEDVSKAFALSVALGRIRENGETLEEDLPDILLSLHASGCTDNAFTALHDNGVGVLQRKWICQAMLKESMETMEEIESAYKKACKQYIKNEDKDSGGSAGTPVTVGGGGTKQESSANPTPEGVKPPTQQVYFSDLENVAWAKESIEALAQMGIIEGMGNGQFSPEAYLTREQFVKILVEAFDIERKDVACPFTDVETDAWYTPYIKAAYAAGIVMGVHETEFGVGTYLTREQLCTLLYRIVPKETLKSIRPYQTFSDEDMISPYAKDAIRSLYEAQIIDGMDSANFMPRGVATRAQGAKLVYGCMKGVAMS